MLYTSSIVCSNTSSILDGILCSFKETTYKTGIRYIFSQVNGLDHGPTSVCLTETNSFLNQHISYPQCWIKQYLLSLRLNTHLVGRRRESLGEGSLYSISTLLTIVREHFTLKQNATYNLLLEIINSIKNNFWEKYILLKKCVNKTGGTARNRFNLHR